MTTILLVAEGEHELGARDGKGALAILVRRLLNMSDTIVFKCRKVADEEFRRYRPRGKGKRYAKVVAGFLRSAERHGFDGVVFLIDEDGDPERRNAMEDGQSIPEPPLPRACGLAIRTFDAWMLADERSLGNALGESVTRQPDPEELKHPKDEFARLHERSPCHEPPRGVYAGIARQVDLDELARRCPRGFSPFVDRIGELRAGLANSANF